MAHDCLNHRHWHSQWHTDRVPLQGGPAVRDGTRRRARSTGQFEERKRICGQLEQKLSAMPASRSSAGMHRTDSNDSTPFAKPQGRAAHSTLAEPVAHERFRLNAQHWRTSRQWHPRFWHSQWHARHRHWRSQWHTSEWRRAGSNRPSRSDREAEKTPGGFSVIPQQPAEQCLSNSVVRRCARVRAPSKHIFEGAHLRTAGVIRNADGSYTFRQPRRWVKKSAGRKQVEF